MRRTFRIASAVLLFVSLNANAKETRCVVDPELGLPVPDTTPGICVAERGSTVVLVSALNEGLLVTAAAGPSDLALPTADGRLFVRATGEPSRVIFCPARPPDAAGGSRFRGCIADPVSLEPGRAAFAGSAQTQASILASGFEAAGCPASVHLRGAVNSPAGESLNFSSSLVLLPRAGGERGCESMEQEVKLSYAASRSGALGGSGAAETPAGPPAILPGAQFVMAGSASGMVSQATPGGGQASPTNQGIPQVLTQLAVTQAKVDALAAAFQTFLQQNPTSPFDVDVTWCAEVGAETAIKPKGFPEFHPISIRGEGGVNVYGNGLTGSVQFGAKARLEFETAAKIAPIKLRVWVKGPVSKALDQAVTAQLVAASNEIAQGLPTLRNRVPDLLDHFQTNGSRLHLLQDQSRALELDPTNPWELFGSLRQKTTDLIGNMPFSRGQRDSLTRAMSFFDAGSLADKLNVCQNLASLPKGVQDALGLICNAAAQATQLKNTITTTGTVVTNIESVVNGISSKLPAKGSNIFN